jgi:hypothetical protein
MVEQQPCKLTVEGSIPFSSSRGNTQVVKEDGL